MGILAWVAVVKPVPVLLDCTMVEPCYHAMFSAAYSEPPTSLAICSASLGESSDSEVTINETTSLLFHPPRLWYRFFRKTSEIVASTTLQPTLSCRRFSTLTSLSSVSVNSLSSRSTPVSQGRQVIPPPRDDQAYTPTHSSRESPTCSKAEASSHGSSVVAFTVQSIQLFIWSLLSVGDASPLPFNSCCFMPDL